MSQTTDRTKSNFTQQREQREQVAVALATERLPFHPAITERFGIQRSDWRALTDAIFPAAKTTEGVILALAYCKARKLDPFKRLVHVVPIWSKEKRGYVETVWPGIGETRTTAMRTGNYGGCDDTKFGPDIERTWTVSSEDDRGQGQQRHVILTFPEWAQVTLYRYRGESRYAVQGPRVYWLETYAKVARNSEVPNEMWMKRPRGQLDKCFGPETEVLTDMGFQRFDAVTGRIMQVTKTGIEPTESRPFQQEWNGPMVSAGGDALNFRVTPNHDMVTMGGKIEAMSLFADATSVPKFRIPISVEGTRPEALISDQAIALTGMFVCDGWRRPYGTFCIGVSRPAKIAAIESLGLHRGAYLRRCAGDETTTETRTITTNHDKTIYTFDESSMGGLAHLDKHFDRDVLISLSRRQAKLLVDAMLASDGADNGRGTMRFYSSHQRILAAFEVAAVAAGYSVSQRRARISDIGGPNYSVTVSDKASLPVLRYSHSQIGKNGAKAGIEVTPTNEDGVVWCCTVPSGVIIVRRHGMSMLCGNCAEAAALRRAFPEELGDEATADEMGDYTGPTIDPDGNVVDGAEVQTKTEPARTTSQSEPAKAGAQQSTGRQGPEISTTSTSSGKTDSGANQTTGAKVEPVTQERKVEPKTDPKTEPAKETTTKTAQSSPLTGAATSTSFDPETGEIKDEEHFSGERGFEAWVVDANDVETTPDPYSDAMQFAAALTKVCAGQTADVVAAILDKNEAAIADCRDASAPAAAIIDAISVPKSTAAEPASDEAPFGQDQGSATNVEPLIEVMAVPQTPNGKPHWPNYTTAVKERLDRCVSAEEAAAWMAKNKPAYFGKCTIATENQIQRHYDQTLARFSGQSNVGTAPDADRELATKIGNELKASNSLDALRTMNQRQDVLGPLARWQNERPELFNEVRAIANIRAKDLQAV
jgi:phage recombination protein Bet